MTYKQDTTTLGALTYTYNLAGNRLTTGGTFARTGVPPALTTTNYNANNQQLTFGTTTETYDLNGNLATVTDTSGTTTYTWNARNQPIGISGPSLTASFTYDSFGRRTGKTINGTTTNFLYDGLNPVQEKNGATVTANLFTGLGIDDFFTRTDGVGTRALLTDALGSTVALGDGIGTLQTQYTYEPFGFTTQTGSVSTNSYKYTGREDDGTGLYYYRARYYQPRLQRFIMEDPIGLLGGINRYTYIQNNPSRLIDPLGLSPEECKDDYFWFWYLRCLIDPNCEPDVQSEFLSYIPMIGGTQSGSTGDEKLQKKADDLISGSLKRSKSYHSEYGDKTYQQIKDLANGGDRRAGQMKKLIEQGQRLRQK